MKKIFTILALLITLSLSVEAQAPKPILIADETELTYTPTGKQMKVITCNATIANKLVQHFGPLKTLKYSFQFREDRHGKYGEWTFYFKPECKAEVIKTVQ